MPSKKYLTSKQEAHDRSLAHDTALSMDTNRSFFRSLGDVKQSKERANTDFRVNLWADNHVWDTVANTELTAA